MIRALGEDLFEVNKSSGRGSNYVCFLPDQITLHGATIDYQFFANPSNFGPKFFDEAFPDTVQDLIKAAKFYKQGTVNKEGLVASIDALLIGNLLSPPQHKLLMSMVKGCNCAPAILKRKIIEQGFSEHFIEKFIKYREEDPRLSRSVATLIDWWEEYKVLLGEEYGYKDTQ